MSVISRITNQGKLKIADEIIEYPVELEAGRNLLPTDYESFVVDDNIYGRIKLADDGTPLTVKVYDTGSDVDMTGIYFGLTKTGKNFTGGGSFWFMNSGNLQRTEAQTKEVVYFSFYPPNRVTFDSIFEKYKIKVDTPWTPTPEDLGMDYPDDIQHFSTGFRSNGKVLVREFIEGDIVKLSNDKKLYVNELIEGVDL